jgi:hypothetical protein
MSIENSRPLMRTPAPGQTEEARPAEGAHPTTGATVQQHPVDPRQTPQSLLPQGQGPQEFRTRLEHQGQGTPLSDRAVALQPQDQNGASNSVTPSLSPSPLPPPSPSPLPPPPLSPSPSPRPSSSSVALIFASQPNFHRRNTRNFSKLGADEVTAFCEAYIQERTSDHQYFPAPRRLIDALLGQVHESFSYSTDQDIVSAMDILLRSNDEEIASELRQVTTRLVLSDMPPQELDKTTEALRSGSLSSLIDDQQRETLNLRVLYENMGSGAVEDFMCQLFEKKGPGPQPAPLSPSPSPAPSPSPSPALSWRRSGVLRWANRPDFLKTSTRALKELGRDEASAFCREYVRDETNKPNRFSLPDESLRKIDAFVEEGRGRLTDQEIVGHINRFLDRHSGVFDRELNEAIFDLVTGGNLPQAERRLAKRLLRDDMCRAIRENQDVAETAIEPFRAKIIAVHADGGGDGVRRFLEDMAGKREPGLQKFS